MYEVSFWIDGFQEDACRFETLEEAMRAFEKWVGDYAKDLRSQVDYLSVATFKIQKMEDVISVVI